MVATFQKSTFSCRHRNGHHLSLGMGLVEMPPENCQPNDQSSQSILPNFAKQTLLSITRKSLGIATANTEVKVITGSCNIGCLVETCNHFFYVEYILNKFTRQVYFSLMSLVNYLCSLDAETWNIPELNQLSQSG